MRNYLLLLRIRLKEARSPAKLISVVLYAVLFAAFYAAADFIAAHGFASALPVCGYIGAAVLCFAAVVLSINETFSGKDDSEFLLSMPIASSAQVFVMFTRMYAKSFLYTLLIELPFYLVCRSQAAVPAFCPGAFIAGLFLTSLPVCGIATMVGIFLVLCLVDSPKKDSILSCISLFFISLALFILLYAADQFYLIGSGRLRTSGESLSAQAVAVITKNIRLAGFYQKGLVEGDVTYIFLFVFMSFIWYAVFLFIHTMSYRTVITALRSPVTHGPKAPEVILGSMKPHSVFRALWKKEITQFVGSKAYLTRSVSGLLPALMVPLDLLILDFHPVQYSRAVPALICAFAAFSSTGYCSMSMEGKRSWILNAAPIDAASLRHIKLAVNLTPVLCAAALSGILFSLVFRPGPVGVLCYILLPLIYVLLAGLYGAFLGERFADYRCESEILILRRGLPYLLGYLPSVLLPLFIFFLLL